LVLEASFYRLSVPKVAPMSHALSYRTPAYRKHKPSGLAVVTLKGKVVHIGIFGSGDSRRAETFRFTKACGFATK
jgi:hypothetical protein